jgi:hypothetical protein
MSLTVAMLAGLRSLTTIGRRQPDSPMPGPTRSRQNMARQNTSGQNMAADAVELPEKDSNPHLGDQNPSS